MLAAGLGAAVNVYLAELVGQCGEHGRRVAMRNGLHAERTLSISAGVVQARALVPRVNDRQIGPETGERKRCSSAILRPSAHETPKTVKKISEDEEVLPVFFGYPAERWIYLRTTDPIESTFFTLPFGCAPGLSEEPVPVPPGRP